MKIKQEHYSKLLEAIRPLAPKLAAHREFVIKEGKAKDVDMRVRWDAMHAAKIDDRPSYRFVCDVLYKEGLNDTHIDTALKKIMQEIA